MIVIQCPAHVELAVRQMHEALSLVKAERRLVARIHAQQQAIGAGRARVRDRFRHQALAGAAAVKAAEQVDALEFQVARRVRARQLGTGDHGVTDRSVSDSSFGQPDGGDRIKQPRAVLRRGVRPGAMRDDGGAVENAGEGFQESGLADQCQGVGVGWLGAANR